MQTFFPHVFSFTCAHGSQGLCSSVSHALMHFQAHNDHLLLSSKEQFSFLWEDYVLLPNPTAGSSGMNITVKSLSPLDPHGEFAPVQEAFTTTVQYTYQTQICLVSNPVSASGTNPWLSLGALEKGNPDQLSKRQSLAALLLEQDLGTR